MKNTEKMYDFTKTEAYSPNNLVPISETKFLNVSSVFENYRRFVYDYNSQNPQKKLYKPRDSFVKFWIQVDKFFYQTTGKTFFEWFYELYFQEHPLSLKDISLRFNTIIHPDKRDERSFRLFIKFFAFVDTRNKEESLNTSLSKIRLKNRPRHIFSDSERQKGVETKNNQPGYSSEIVKKGWQKLSPEERRDRGLKSVETRQRNQMRIKLIQTIQNIKILKALEPTSSPYHHNDDLDK